MANGQANQQTRWLVVWIAFGAGIVAATHIGKLPPALPAIRAETGAGLVAAGWIASMISCTGFALGLFAGSLADRFGQRRVILAGLFALALGSIAGAFAHSPEAMLAARFVEGLGFTSTTVAGAAIIVRATSPEDRRWALGFWSSYLPIGFAGMLIAGSLVLETIGWRILWVVCAAISVVWAAAVWHATKRQLLSAGGGASADTLTRNVIRTVQSRGAVLAAACFAVYAAQHISMMNWLPTYMHEIYGAAALSSAALPAVVLLFNAAGNWLSARLLGRGVAIWKLLLAGAVGMAATEVGIFSAAVPDAVRLALLLLFGIFGGLIPAAALGSIATYTPSPVLIGTMNGLMVMGTNTGQLFGPPALAAAREAAGSWNGAIWLVLALAATGTVLALLSRPLERRAAVD
jgi:DHA1 family inner membrane transport protein